MPEGPPRDGGAPRPVVTVHDDVLDAPELAADQVYERAELEEFVQRRTALAPEVVRTVLDLYDERLAAAGVLEHEGRDFRYYDAQTVAEIADEVVDPDQVAADAQRLAGVGRAQAASVLDAELAYLEAKGLA